MTSTRDITQLLESTGALQVFYSECIENPKLGATMRTTLACQWCRKAKVKCHHDGSPPCRSCSLYPERTCALSTPTHRSKRRKYSPQRSSGNLPLDGRALSPVGSPSGPGIQGETAFMPVSQSFRTHDTTSMHPSTQLQCNYIPELNDSKLVEHAFHIFVRHFPEFRVFHQPTFLALLDNKRLPNILLSAIFALSARFLPELVTVHGTPGKASEYFANHVRQNVMARTMEAMDIHTVQTLFMLSLYDWGHGDGSRAWTYNGMATRIANGVHAQAKAAANVDDSFSNRFRLEEACRTVWACFLLDSMIGCGKCHASNFSMSINGVPLPLGEDEFAFGSTHYSQPLYLATWDPEVDDYEPSRVSSMANIGTDRTSSLLVQGFYIWQLISSWVSSGGRKREAPSSREPPWRPRSFWSRSMSALEDWRASQSPRLIYSTTNVNLQVYISQGEGERFALTNLLYYLNLIFLHREYTPFIPQPSNHPQGPVDPPLLTEEAPVGWWDQSAQTLLASASNVVRIMQELDRRGVQFQAPFTSFCVFTAATTLAYMDAWEYMAPGIDRQLSSELFTWASSWLHRSCKVWRVATGWYRSLLALRQLYTQAKSDPRRFLRGVGAEKLPALEESIHRLAGSETSDISDVPTANILLLLQRQQVQSRTDRRSTDFMECHREPVETTFNAHQHHLVNAEQLANADNQSLSSDYILDHNLITSILSDPSGSVFRPFEFADFSM
ncbi:hypothetical protein BJY01DRAFT_220227 [Aspergillus pseudoustus]|uniref:Zn(2)-C6 fungal-type domain-containing protein n=1 Tax=Aspergillus pseudoustus TaxID=1810923 RepID=A0ABR4JDG6_9EURO